MDRGTHDRLRKTTGLRRPADEAMGAGFVDRRVHCVGYPQLHVFRMKDIRALADASFHWSRSIAKVGLSSVAASPRGHATVCRSMRSGQDSVSSLNAASKRRSSVGFTDIGNSGQNLTAELLGAPVGICHEEGHALRL
ncbi:hypothetical protein [Neomesorhizobium albiziae]|uniref:hypothetical protein n=1 Tax=Neomesorhizobium albiziae TaxID=335020 RepID=UPI00165F76FE|nr:hypothetical protein [Mesorhizobium albiziae]